MLRPTTGVPSPTRHAVARLAPSSIHDCDRLTNPGFSDPALTENASYAEADNIDEGFSGSKDNSGTLAVDWGLVRAIRQA